MNLCIQLQASLTPCARAHALLILFDNCIYLKHPTCSGILRLKNSWMMVGYKKYFRVRLLPTRFGYGFGLPACQN